ncbi:hypothetical protein HDU79_002039 [Rhizoclosmatium sp. JEL0117]|nr:hypothetical protein HDU79_002039 [Rhizoclosmatium sp. JEL0117]
MNGLQSTLETWYTSTKHSPLIAAFLLVSAIADGLVQPARNVLLGRFVDALQSPNTPNLAQLTFDGAAVATAAFLVGAIRSAAFSFFASKIRSGLRRRLFDASLGAAQTASTANKLENIHAATKKIEESVPAIVQCIMLFVAGLVIALRTSVTLSLAILASFPFVALILSRMWQTNQDNDVSAKVATESAARVAHEVLSNIETILSLNMQSAELKRYSDYVKQCSIVLEQNALVNGFGWGLYHCTMFLAFAVAFWTGGSLVNQGILTAGDVLVCFTQLAVGITALGNIGSHLNSLRHADTLLVSILDVQLEVSSKSDSSIDTSSLPPFKGLIEFQNVSFAYPSRPNDLILSNLSFKITPGSTTALVAESGSGKSTIFALLLRLYTPTNGAIFIDGIDIQNIDPSWLRDQFVVVEQVTSLIEGLSVFENVTLGSPNASVKDVKGALEMAGIDAVIDSLPDGLWTVLGGVNGGFSGGQRQRLGVARGCLMGITGGRGIVLLDEPTSALDSESEAHVQKGLDIFCQNKTTLLITHRVAMLHHESVSHVLVLEKGRIVESGCHQDLLELPNSRYKQLFDHDTASTSNVLTIPSVTTTVPKSITKADEQSPAEPILSIPWTRLFDLAKPHLSYFILAVIGQLLEGLIAPTQGFLISSVVTSYSLPHAIQFRETVKYSLGLIALGIYNLLCCCISEIGSSYSRARLAADVKVGVLQKALLQNLDFFDEERFSVGKLEMVLVDGIQFVEAVPGAWMSRVVKATVTGVLGLGVALWYSWRFVLGVFVFVPVVVLIVKLQGFVVSRFQTPSTQSIENSSRFILSTAANSRTITILNASDFFHKRYETLESVAHKAGVRYHLAQALVGAPLRDAVIILLATAGLHAGAHLIHQHGVKADEMVIVLTTVTLSVVETIGVVGGLSGLGEAARRVWKVLQVLDYEGIKDGHENVLELNGELAVEFIDVGYEYAGRKGVRVLDGYNLKVKVGDVAMLTGGSGSGKSTCIQLLQKLRRPQAGSINLFGQEISKLDANILRSQVVTVSQSSRLFRRTISENISLSNPSVNLEDIERAAKLACAHDFISKLSGGYNTVIGDGESLLSEGQKQRICIARAIAQDPKVLILDEATSGLDGETERSVVQEILKWKNMDNRRSLIVSSHTPHVWEL